MLLFTGQTTPRVRDSIGDDVTRCTRIWLLVSAASTIAFQMPMVQASDSKPASQLQTGNAIKSDMLPGDANPGPSTISFVRNNPRSPTGLLYARPFMPREMKPIGDGGWLMRGFIEGGYLFSNGDARNAGFSEYADFSEDPILSRFGLTAENPEKSTYLRLSGGSVARDDQHYSLSFGKYNVYRADAWFTGVPHVFASNARVLWDGAGTGNLTLPEGLIPGASTRDQVAAAFQSIDESEISLKREESGFALSYMPTKTVTVEGALTHERRKGARPYGGAFIYPTLGQVSETVEPIDYNVLDWRLSVGYVRPRFQANLSYSGSSFENDTDTLTFENPGLASFAGPYTAPRGRHALAPDNQYHAFRGDASAQFDKWNGRWTFNANYAISKQDEDLLPPGVNGNPADPTGLPVDLSLWNTTAALSQQTAGARFDRFTLVSELTAQPSRDLRLSAKLRYEDQDNKTDYTAFNPLTGEYGYLALDGGLSGNIPSFSRIFDTSDVGRRVRYRSMPFEKDLLSFKGTVDYRLSRKARANLYFEFREEDRVARERRETRDKKIGLELVNRDMGKYTLRVTYEYADRGGGTYIPNPYEPYYTSSLPGFVTQFPDGNRPHTLDELRKFDLADRTAHKIDAKANFTLGERADLMLSGSYETKNFDADYGLKKADRTRVNAEWNFQVDTSATLYMFYSFQDNDRLVANINDTGFGSSDGSAGGAIYPLAGAWEQGASDRHHSFGAGYSKRWDAVTLKIDYVFTKSTSGNVQSFNSTAAFFDQFTLDEVGTGLPAIEFENHYLNGEVDWAVSAKISLRLLYRFESDDISDFHYQGLSSPLIGNDIYLAAVPQDFSAHVLGGFVRFKF